MKFKYLFIIPILFGVTSCEFIGMPLTSDPWELISTARVRMEQFNRPLGARYVLNEAVRQAEKRNDQLALATAYNELGRTYVRQEGDTKTAEQYYLRSKEINEKNGFRQGLLENYFNLANVYQIKQEPQKACANLSEFKRIFDELERHPAPPPKGAAEKDMEWMKGLFNPFSASMSCGLSV